MKCLLAALTLLLSLQAYASAAFTVYTDRTAFLNAASGAGLTTKNEDFATNPGDPFTIDDGAGNAITLDITRGNFGQHGLVNRTAVILNSTSVVGSVVGIGFHTGTVGGGQKGAELSINGGVFTGSRPNNGFLGLLSTDGMSIAAVDDMRSKISNAGTFDFVKMDDIVIATGTPVPEPSSLVLFMLGGLLTGGVAYRRRRRKSTAEV